MYEIVVDVMREKRKIANKQFERRISDSVFFPVYNKLKADKSLEIKEIFLLRGEPTLIYPLDSSIVLNPVSVIYSTGDALLRYFVLIENIRAIYEWTYFEPVKLNSDKPYFNSELLSQLKKITDWNFGFETLDDSSFWNNYVFVKENSEFKYLKIVSKY
jgi:hypothetical protein